MITCSDQIPFNLDVSEWLFYNQGHKLKAANLSFSILEKPAAHIFMFPPKIVSYLDDQSHPLAYLLLNFYTSSLSLH